MENLYRLVTLLATGLALYSSLLSIRAYRKSQDINFFAVTLGFSMMTVVLGLLVVLSIAIGVNAPILRIIEHYGLFVCTAAFVGMVVIPDGLGVKIKNNQYYILLVSNLVLLGFLIFVLNAPYLQQLLIGFFQIISIIVTSTLLALIIHLWYQYHKSKKNINLFFIAGFTSLALVDVFTYIFNWTSLSPLVILVGLGFMVFGLRKYTMLKYSVKNLSWRYTEIHNRLGYKNFFLFIIIGIIPLIILSILHVNKLNDTLSTDIINNTIGLTASKSSQVSLYFELIKNDASDFASDTEIQKLIVSNNTKELANHISEKSKAHKGTIKGGLIIDLTGKIIAATDKKNREINASQLEYYIEGRKKAYLNIPTQSTHTYFNGDILISMPITNLDNKELLGVLVLEYSVDDFEKYLSSDFGDKMSTSLINMANYQSLPSLYVVNTGKRVFASDTNVFKNEYRESIMDTAPVNKCFNSGQSISGEEYKTYNNERVIGTTKCFPELGLVLIVEVNLKALTKIISSTQSQSVLIISITAFFIGLTAWFGSWLITSPINNLRLATIKLAKGDFKVRASTNSNDEIAELGHAFNLMANNISKNVKYISEKNEDLANTKSAMVNILEDLEKEKTGLERSKAKDEAILASVGEGMIFTDANGKIEFVNVAASRILQLDISTANGEYLSDVITLIDGDGKIVKNSQRPINKVTKMEKTISIKSSHNYTCKRLSGTVFPIVLTVTPVMLNNKLIGTIQVFRDITTEKNIDIAKTEFVSLASHQLRTPLSAIKWYTEMLLEDDKKLSKQQMKYLGVIDFSNNRMIDLINSLLNVSRLELGTFSVEPTIINIKKLIEHILIEMTASINARKIKLTTKIARIPDLTLDAKLMTIIFQNLLSNAVKYTKEKGKVELRAYIAEKGEMVDKFKVDKTSLIIMVNDNGYGIPSDQEIHIFEKLFRADNVRIKDTEGTGLGLYIVKSIIENAKGKIWFKSKENKGTTFYIILPTDGMKKKVGTKTLN